MKRSRSCSPAASRRPRPRSRRRSSPPWVIFRWGGLTGFLAYISQRHGEVHAVHRQRPADPGGRARCTLEELAGEAPEAEPDVGRPRAAPRARARRRATRSPAIAYAGVRRPRPLARGRRAQPHRRPDAAAARAAGCCSRPWRTLGRPRGAGRRRSPAGRRARCRSVRSTAAPLVVAVERHARCRPTWRPQLVSGYVDDSSNVPDMFVLRFPDDGRDRPRQGRLRDRREGASCSCRPAAPAARSCCSTAR